MALTPVSAALDRSTPGFDTLVNALQSTTERIHRNREFARQVQARQDFAQFQADLQFENRLREVNEILPRRLEVESAAALKQAEETARLEEDLTQEFHPDRLERRGDELDLEVDAAVTQAERVARAQEEVAADTFDDRLDRTVREAEETGEVAMGFFEREQSAIEARQISVAEITASLRTERDDVDIQNNIAEDFSDKYDVLKDDTLVELHPPRLTEDGEFAPVTVQLEEGQEPVELEYGQYLQYLDTHRERKLLQNEIQRLLESQTIDRHGTDGRVGKRQLRQFNNRLNNTANNFTALTKAIDEIRGFTPEHIDSFEIGAGQKVMEMSSSVKPLFSPFSNRTAIPGIRNLPEPQMDVAPGSPEYEQVQRRVNTFIDSGAMSYGNVIGNVGETDLTDSQINNIQTNIGILNENLGILDIPENYRDYIFNWEYDPSTQHYSKMFLTREQATSKLMKRLTGSNQDPDIQSANQSNNPVRQRYQQRFQNLNSL